MDVRTAQLALEGGLNMSNYGLSRVVIRLLGLPPMVRCRERSPEFKMQLYRALARLILRHQKPIRQWTVAKVAGIRFS